MESSNKDGTRMKWKHPHTFENSHNIQVDSGVIFVLIKNESLKDKSLR